MKTKFDFLIFIGRFQPYHNGHKIVVDQALEQAKKVIILVGSTNKARDNRDPWSFQERAEMITSAHLNDDRLVIVNLPDKHYNDQAWIKLVQNKVTKAILDNAEGNSPHVTLHGMDSQRVGLIGHQKDGTSYYLKMFPNWKSISVVHFLGINATDIREKYFTQPDFHPKGLNIPNSVDNFLKEFRSSATYFDLVNEHNHIKSYRHGWKDAPYPPIFVTVDAVVVQSGHILLVERGAQPGKGLLALPGGFLNQRERLDDAVIRELREETKLKVPDPVLRGSIKDKRIFDEPYRSTRGRTITYAYLFELTPQEELPKVKGSSDAKSAMWVPLNELDPHLMFEDHYHIINALLGGIN